MSKTTGSKKWGVIAGDHFGYELDTCTVLGEYKIDYQLAKALHIMIYEKDGVIGSAPKKRMIPRFRRATVGGAFLKAGFFAVLMLVLLSTNSVCRKYANTGDTNIFSMSTVCEHKNIAVFIFAVLLIAAYTGIVVYFRIRSIKKDLETKKKE